MKTLWIIILTVSLSLIGCREKKSTPSTLELYPLDGKIESIAPEVNRMVCIMEGDCVLCLAKLIDFNDRITEQKEKFNFPLFYIIMTDDFRRFSTNLESMDIRIKGEIIMDSAYVCKTNNLPLLESNFDVFLVNSNNNILIHGNPFEDNKISKLYKEFE